MAHPARRPEQVETPLTVTGLMVWVAGLAAIAGLVEEAIRMSRVEPTAGVIGGMLVGYVVYLALSIRVFWKAPPLVVPVAMLIGGVLWTLALQWIERRNLLVAALILPTLPFAMAIALRIIFRGSGDPDEPAANLARPSTVRCLLMRSRGFGPRPAPVKVMAEPEI